MRNLQPIWPRLAARLISPSLIVTATLLTGCAADRETRDSLSAGYSALQARQYDQAIGIADQQLQHSNGNGAGTAEALYLKGMALEAKPAQTPTDARQNIAAAREAYTQGVAAVAKERNPSLEARLHNGVANTSYWMDDYTVAMSEWSRAYDGLDDPNTKSFALYRIGICQQRLGQWEQADHTFATVLQQYPASEVAGRAKARQGARSFALQLATFKSAATADATTTNLRNQGAAATKTLNTDGNSVVTVGPFPTYPQAQAARSRFASSYPDALIVP